MWLDGDINAEKTIDHLITQHNALCEYLAERENGANESRSDTYGINTTLPVAYRGEYQKPTTTDTTMKLTPLFKAEDVEIVESWLPTFGTEQLMVYSIHIEFKTKEAAEQAREALLRLTDTPECNHHQSMREGGSIGLDQDGKCLDCGEQVLSTDTH